jgi:phage baseplate assembly protein gpV
VTLTLFESIQQIVRDELARARTAELATVQKQQPHKGGSDTDNYACTIALRDSGIVLEQVPVATGRIGTASIPAVGDLVVVQFLNGDINSPVIVGRLYNDEDRPPPNDDGQAIWHLPNGASDDDAVHLEVHSNGSRKAIVNLGGGFALELQDDDPVVALDVGGGSAKVTIKKDGTIEIRGKDIRLEADSEIDIKAGGTLTLKGATVNIN